MSWPIILTAKQSEAVMSAVEDFSKSLTGEARAIYAVVLHQMRTGIALDLEEQELVRGAVLARARSRPGKNIETAYFRLYGVWPVRPTWWELAGPTRRGRPKRLT